MYSVVYVRAYGLRCLQQNGGGELEEKEQITYTCFEVSLSLIFPSLIHMLSITTQQIYSVPTG